MVRRGVLRPTDATVRGRTGGRHRFARPSCPRRPALAVAGLGYWVVPGARRCGWATRSVCLATDWALGRGGTTRVEAWVEPDDVPSQRVLARCGFVREGVLRSGLEVGARRTDVVVFARTAVDPSSTEDVTDPAP
ncbi:GNAT family N-acetyltransferase [Geodermatophilus sp. TF02-6]|uniref:GNAT family N-acetyltransferase n=1 Tax=Geodermatophilus sp. TF02-6 TaxID=2250575 RepID=UPI00351AAA24